MRFTVLVRLRHWVLLSAWLLRAGPVSAADPGPAVVWYRASEECPSGPEFASKLAGRSLPIRLAEAGDHLDFVVTLIATGQESVGRLERQTRTGVVAIRELRDSSCSKVAEALALSLALTLDPAQEEHETVDPAPANEPAPGAAAIAPSTSALGANVAAPAAVAPAETNSANANGATDASSTRVGADHAEPARQRSLWVGAAGGAMTGVASDPLPRISAFVDLEGAIGRNSVLRFGGYGAWGSESTTVGPVHRWILAARAEACPWRWGSSVALAPCLAFEMGTTGGESTRATARSALGFWTAPGLTLHASARLLSSLRLEIEAGAVTPLVRQEVYAGSQSLYRSEFIVLNGAVGISWRVP